LTFLSTFTWSRNWDESGAGPGNTLNGGNKGPQNPYNMAGEYSFSNIDTPLHWATAVTYELPFGKGKPFLGKGGVMNYIAGGWVVNAVSVFQTGFPLQITQSTNFNSGFGYASQRPNATGVSPVTSGSLEARLNNYINPAAFSTAPQFTFGNISRTIDMRGPGQANWDMSVFKKVYFGSENDKRFLQIRLEAYNVFNHTNWATLNTAAQFNPTTGALVNGANPTTNRDGFGALTAVRAAGQAGSSRIIQLAAKFSF